MSTLITYDIDQGHADLKNGLFKVGFYNLIKGSNGKQYQLPNTTVMHNSDDIDQVLKLFNGVLKQINPKINLEKYICVQFTNASFASNIVK